MTRCATITRRRVRLVWVFVSVGLLLVAGANAHLVYVAFQSQPGCVEHVKAADEGNGYQAAQSAC
jgi:hypothetical protein